MHPRLAVIAGRLKGKVFPIPDDLVVLGREATATFSLPDPSVSRRHSSIERDGDSFVIADLGSLNGTFVNDVPVKRRTLRHGDRVRIGDSQFLFLLHDEDEVMSNSSEVHFDERQIGTALTMQMSFNDAVYLMARDLSLLMKVSTTINAIRGLEELEKKLLELLFEVVPAQRGAILLADETQQDEPTAFSSVFGLDRIDGPGTAVKVSRTIVRQVFEQATSLLVSDPTSAGPSSESLLETLAVSVLCVPLIMVDRAIGVIYLETSEPGVRFDRDHLQLITAVAAIAAVAIENARHIEWLEHENQRLRADMNIEHNMVGESRQVKQVFQFIAKAAPTESTVLIEGESGTGKELVARAIHQNSRRSDKTFMALNCAALSESLLESELFGHEKGAFTGAINQKKGRLELADGGTVFLDEIGELPLPLQVKLLRVLQQREFERVGGTRTIKLDIRLVAATNRNLEEAIARGEFRQDLYYRLNVVSLEMPALRDRLEDIPLLASYFASKYGEKCSRKVLGISADAQKLLVGYDWPGNIRELENAIERAVVLGTTERILPEDLPEAILEWGAASPAPGNKYHEAVAQTKKQIILNAMDQAKSNYTEAARLLGVHPNYLHRLIRNLNLREQLKRM